MQDMLVKLMTQWYEQVLCMVNSRISLRLSEMDMLNNHCIDQVRQGTPYKIGQAWHSSTGGMVMRTERLEKVLL